MQENAPRLPFRSLTDSSLRWIAALPKALAIKAAELKADPNLKSLVRFNLQQTLGNADADGIFEAVWQKSLQREWQFPLPKDVDDQTAYWNQQLGSQVPDPQAIYVLDEVYLPHASIHQALKQARLGKPIWVAAHRDTQHSPNTGHWDGLPAWQPRELALLAKRTARPIYFVRLEKHKAGWKNEFLGPFNALTCSAALEMELRDQPLAWSHRHHRHLAHPGALLPCREASHHVLALLPKDRVSSVLCLPLLRGMLKQFPNITLYLQGNREDQDFWQEEVPDATLLEENERPETLHRILVLSEERYSEAKKLGVPLPLCTFFVQDETALLALPRRIQAPTHRVQTYLRFATYLGCGQPDPSWFPKEQPIYPESLPILAPFSSIGSSAEWDATSWQEFLSEIEGPLQLVGTPDQLEQLTQFALQHDWPSPLTGTYAELKPTLAQAPWVLCVEGILSHWVACAGGRALVLFGPGSPTQTRPLGKQHRTHQVKVACNPCFLNECPLDHRCMTRLQVHRIIEEWAHALRQPLTIIS